MPMDEESDGVVDVSGTSNNGTVSGNAVYTSSGQVGGAMAFDGSGDYINVGSSSTLKFSLTDHFTVSAWINVSGTGERQIVANSTGSAPGYQFRVRSTGAVRFILVQDGSNFRYSDTSVLSAGWHHVVGVWNGSSLTTYVDGTLSSTTGSTGTVTNITSTSNTFIGTRPGLTNYFNGSIDEVQIYPRALSIEQIQSLCANGDAGGDGNCTNGVASGGGEPGPQTIMAEEISLGEQWGLTVRPITTSSGALGSTASAGYNVTILGELEAGDVAISNAVSGNIGVDQNIDSTFTEPSPWTGTLGYRWQVDAGSGYENFAVLNLPSDDLSDNLLRDISGEGNHGTPVNSPVLVSGQVGQSLSFNGTDQYVSLPTTGIFDGLDTFTVSAWVRPDVGYAAGDYRAIYYVSDGGSNNLVLQTDVFSGEVRLYMFGVLCQTSGYALAEEEWTHVVGTYDGSNQRIYIDGVLAETCATTGTMTDTGVPKNIGRYEGGGQYFPGEIDELQLYPRTLSAEQIAYLYADGAAGNSGPTKVSYQETTSGDDWKLFNYEINSSADIGGAIEATNSPVTITTPTVDVVAGSNTGNTGDIDLAFTCTASDSTKRTIEITYDVDADASYNHPMTITSLPSGASAEIQATKTVLFNIPCNSGTSNNSITWASDDDGVAMLTTKAIRVRYSLVDITDSAPSDNTSSSFNVSNSLSFTVNAGTATLDIENDLTTSVTGLGTEYTAAYQWQVDSGSGFAPMMMLNMPMDEESDGVEDLSGNNYDGVLAGAGVYTSSGKVGGAMSFSGTDSQITVADNALDSLFDRDDSFSISAWVKSSAGSYQWIVSKITTGNVGFNFYMETGGQLAFSLVANGSTYSARRGAISVRDNTWHHVVGTYDGSGRVVGIRLYVDGVEQTYTTIGSDNLGLSSISNTQNLEIGGRSFNDFHYNGSIDEVQIYPRVLTQEQITHLYNDGAAGVAGPRTWDELELDFGSTYDLDLYPIDTVGAVYAAIGDSFKDPDTGVEITDSTFTGTAVCLNAGSQHSSCSSPDSSADLEDDTYSYAAGLTGAQKGIRHWVVDQDGAGGGAAEDYASLVMPFNIRQTQRDFSGGGHNGLLRGAKTLDSASCKVGRCVDLSGSGDRVEIDDFQEVGNSGTELTVMAWVKWSGGSEMHVVSHYDYGNTQSSWTIGGHPSATTKMRVIAVNDGSYTANNGTLDFYSSVTAWDNTWHHVAFTFDHGLLKLYIDGVRDTNVTKASNGPFPALHNSTAKIAVGGMYNNGSFSNESNGLVDELMIFPRVLSAEQIAQIYSDSNAGNFGLNTVLAEEYTASTNIWSLPSSVTKITQSGIIGDSVVSSNTVTVSDTFASSGAVCLGAGSVPGSCPSATSTLNVGQALTTKIDNLPAGSTGAYRWAKNSSNVEAINIPFNKGQTQYDLSGNAQDGTVTGGAGYVPSGKVGGALEFDGASGYVNRTLSSNYSTEGTISFWFKPDAVNVEQYLTFYGTEVAGTARSMALLATGKLLFVGWTADIANIQPSSAVSTFSVGQWYHVAYTWRGEDGVVVYVNGVEAYTGASTRARATLGLNPVTTHNLYLGRRPAGSYFRGLLDEFQMYGTALNPGQIAALCNAGDSDGDCSDGIDAGQGVSGPLQIVDGDYFWRRVVFGSPYALKLEWSDRRIQNFC